MTGEIDSRTDWVTEPTPAIVRLDAQMPEPKRQRTNKGKAAARLGE